MKNKKFKLFASLTSLVMVVAVMAVGVWAATSATVNVTGTASFSATGIAGTISATANDGAQINGKTTDTLLTANMTDVEVTENATITYSINAGADSLIKADDVAANTFTVIYTITNTGSTALKYTVTVDNDEVPATGVYMVASITDGAESGVKANLASGNVEVEVTYTLTLGAQFAHDGNGISTIGMGSVSIVLANA